VQIWEEVLAVARISDDFLKCVVYLYPNEAAAEEGKPSGASGFLVGFPIEGFVGVLAVVVTNRHVANGCRVLRVNKKDGGIEIIRLGPWAYSLEDDVAVGASGLTDTHAVNVVSYPDHFLSEDLLKSRDIGPGDDCFMVGRFIRHDGALNNRPTARFGHIAQMPGEPITVDRGPPQVCFLVEIHSMRGFSGSPVFVGIRTENAAKLLGMVHAHVFDLEDVVSRKSGERRERVDEDWGVQSNTGIVGVVPGWRIASFLETNPDIRSLRDRVREEVAERRSR
jgi:hypothetical protein